jgi:hypothetical protein
LLFGESLFNGKNKQDSFTDWLTDQPTDWVTEQ